MRQNYFTTARKAYAGRIQNNARRTMDYRIDSADLENHMRELMEPAPGGNHHDSTITNKVGKIAFGGYAMPGFSTIDVDWKVPDQKLLMTDNKPGNQLINISCQLHGNIKSVFAGIRHPLTMQPGTHNLVYLTEQGDTHTIEASQDVSVFQLVVEKDFFIESIADSGAWADRVINDILQNKPFAAAENSFQLTPKMHTMISTLSNVSQRGVRSKLLYQSAVLELLALQLEQYSANTSTSGAAISKEDQQKLYSLKVWLECNFLEEQSLSQLSRRFCLNEFKLKKGFKALFDTTVFGYIRLLRMKHAGDLLLDTTFPIDEIAYTVGYEHPQHFSKAFKDYSGFAPLHYRKVK